MAVRNAGIMKTYLLTMFYGPILPIAYPIAGLTYVIEYWVDKTILLRRTPRPESIST